MDKNVGCHGKIEEAIESGILFAFYDPSIPDNKYASQNKLFEATMCGKPILVSDGTAMADIVMEEKCGLIIPYGDIDAVKRAIKKLKNNPDLCKCLGYNGRKRMKENIIGKLWRDDF